jgi:hypothetical protein
MTVLAAILVAQSALAGPPLLCFPFDIGSARTLPMGGSDWRTVDPAYDVSHLVSDTLGFLAPSAPVVVRMETLRRATIYAAAHPVAAAELMSALKKRSEAKAPLAAFDYGYLVEAFREAAMVFSQPMATEK